MSEAQHTPPVDPNVHVPAAIRQQAERAAQIQREAIEAASKQPVEPEPANDLAPTAAEEQFTPEVKTEAEPAAEPAPAPKPADEGTWEHRYNSMKGRFEAEQKANKGLRDQISQLGNDVSDLRGIIATLEMRGVASPPAEDEPSNERLVTAEEEAEFGTEFLDVVARRAREAVAQDLAKLRKENEALKARVNGVAEVTVKSAREKMLEKLDKDVKNWRDTNYSEDFKQWLALPDPYSGAIRHNMLKAAFERNDAPRVAAFFQGFSAEQAAVAPASEPTPQAPVADKVPLETLAAPGRAKPAGGPASPTEKPTFSRAQVTAFYRDGAAGKYRGREAEYQKLERQIIEAGREGRIR
jgi:hypothetical protein